MGFSRVKQERSVKTHVKSFWRKAMSKSRVNRKKNKAGANKTERVAVKVLQEIVGANKAAVAMVTEVAKHYHRQNRKVPRNRYKQHIYRNEVKLKRLKKSRDSLVENVKATQKVIQKNIQKVIQKVIQQKGREMKNVQKEIDKFRSFID